MSAILSVAIGDQLEPGPFYTDDGVSCGANGAFRCDTDCGDLHHAYCTAPEGHELGDIPHVARGLSLGVVAIWDERGYVYADLDDETGTLRNVGATL